MNLQKSLQHISDLMTQFAEQVKSDNAMGLLDKNRLSEDVLVPILTEVYGYTNLVNLNSRSQNYPGIDLGDEAARVAFQITSDAGSRKIKETLETFVKNEYYRQYDHLIVYIITEKQKSYFGRGWDDIVTGKFRFAKKDDIQDRFDLLRVIRHLPIEKVQKIESVLEQHFGENQSEPIGRRTTQKSLLPKSNAIEQYWSWLCDNLQDPLPVPHLEMFQNIKLPIRVGLPDSKHQYRVLETSKLDRNTVNTTLWEKKQDDEIVATGVDQALNDFIHVIRIHRRILVVGDSGSGKSTLLRRFAEREAKRLCKRGFEKARGHTPVLVELWQFSLERPLLELTLKSIRRSHVDISKGQLLTALRRGYVILLLDGLDEVPAKDRHECLAQIISLVEEFPRTLTVLTSRPFPKPLSQFHRIEIKPLMHVDIVWALHAHFGSTREFRKRFDWYYSPQEYVSFGLKPEVFQLSRRPLTLGMLATLLATDGKLPETLYEVYERFLSGVLDWEVCRGLLHSIASTTAALEETAYVMAGRTQMSLTSIDWMKVAGQAVSRLREVNIATGSSAEEILWLLLSTGLLRDLGGEILFSHTSLLEYFAARRIVNSSTPAHKDHVALNPGVARFLGIKIPNVTILLEEHLLQCNNVNALIPLLEEFSNAECEMGRFEALYWAIRFAQEIGVMIDFLNPSEKENCIDQINQLVEISLDFSPKALSILKDAAYGVIVVGTGDHARLWLEKVVEGLEAYGWPGAKLYQKLAEIGFFENLDVFNDDGFDLTARERVDVFYAYLEAIDKDDFIEASKQLEQIDSFIRLTKL